MARIRSFKPECLTHRKVGRLSIAARWLWFALVTQADDQGRVVVDPGQVRLIAFGYDDDLSVAKVSDLLAEIAATGLIRCYEVASVPYAYFPSWLDHQRIDRPSPSKLPSPPQSRSTKARRKVVEGSTRIRGGSEGRDRIKDQGSEGREAGDVSPAPPLALSLSRKDAEDRRTNGEPEALSAHLEGMGRRMGFVETDR